jgi:hypothetical protein
VYIYKYRRHTPCIEFNKHYTMNIISFIHGRNYNKKMYIFILLQVRLNEYIQVLHMKNIK